MSNKNEKESFDFTAALHTYYKVPDCRATTVRGLKGLYSDTNSSLVICSGVSFWSKAASKEGVEDRDLVTFGKEVDRKYFNAPDRLEILARFANSKFAQTAYLSTSMVKKPS